MDQATSAFLVVGVPPGGGRSLVLKLSGTAVTGVLLGIGFDPSTFILVFYLLATHQRATGAALVREGKGLLPRKKEKKRIRRRSRTLSNDKITGRSQVDNTKRDTISPSRSLPLSLPHPSPHPHPPLPRRDFCEETRTALKTLSISTSISLFPPLSFSFFGPLSHVPLRCF